VEHEMSHYYPTLDSRKISRARIDGHMKSQDAVLQSTSKEMVYTSVSKC